ncbi:MAG TPA: hypothetical protein VMD91_13860 [Candidatus Sulfotelmatobacter sp.]|nr:hypothetical protein [Candidatus Sulfotelmatobacter sp.]
MSDAEDRALLERISGRDRLAFEAFFTAHWQPTRLAKPRPSAPRRPRRP